MPNIEHLSFAHPFPPGRNPMDPDLVAELLRVVADDGPECPRAIDLRRQLGIVKGRKPEIVARETKAIEAIRRLGQPSTAEVARAIGHGTEPTRLILYDLLEAGEVRKFRGRRRGPTLVWELA